MATTALPNTPNVQMAPIETTNGRHFLSMRWQAVFSLRTEKVSPARVCACVPQEHGKNKSDHPVKDPPMPIPRIIHVFWQGRRDPIVEACIARMHEINSGWDVRRYDAYDECEEVEGFDALRVQAKSDWLRICLIVKYGGLWLDATTICVDHVETWLDVAAERVVGFECPIKEGQSTPALENWAFAARPGHPLARAWQREFGHAIRVGFDAYKAQNRDALGAHPIYGHMPYLTMHGAYLKVHDDAQVFMRNVYDCDFGPFYYQRNHHKNGSKNRWIPTFRLFVADPRHPPLMKFTGEQRCYANNALAVMPLMPGSFMHKKLHLHPRVGRVGLLVLLALVALVGALVATGRARARTVQKTLGGAP